MVLKLKVFFLIYQKLLTQFDTKAWFSNEINTEFQKMFVWDKKILKNKKILSKVLFLMVKDHPRLTPLLVSLKDLFSVPCFSWYISTIYQMAYLLILNYLQKISFFFQLCTTKTFQQMNLTITYKKLVTACINGKWASTLILSNNTRR